MITTAGSWQVLVKHIDHLVIARLVMAALRNGGKTVPHALGQAFDDKKSFPAGRKPLSQKTGTNRSNFPNALTTLRFCCETNMRWEKSIPFSDRHMNLSAFHHITTLARRVVTLETREAGIPLCNSTKQEFSLVK